MTVAPGGIDLLPFFQETERGRLFGIRRTPSDRAVRGAVLFVPPFAEELNMSRRMVALTAAALAGAGYAVTTLDPLGCGDSDGAFGDGTPEIWLSDIAEAVRGAKAETPGDLTLWGLRFGATLAAAAAHAAPEGIDRLLLWQPVASGRQMLTQFLRIRVAAGLAQSGERETTKDLRQRIADGEAIEVAGYEINAAMADGIEALELATLTPPPGVACDWLEVAPGEETALPPVSARVTSGWQEAGAVVRTRVVAGEAFWSIQETTLAPALLEATVEALA